MHDESFRSLVAGAPCGPGRLAVGSLVMLTVLLAVTRICFQVGLTVLLHASGPACGCPLCQGRVSGYQAVFMPVSGSIPAVLGSWIVKVMTALVVTSIPATFSVGRVPRVE